MVVLWLLAGVLGLKYCFFSGLRVVMPIFEYKCVACGEVTEFLEKASSKAKHICKDCGGDKMDKQFSTFAPVVELPAVTGRAAHQIRPEWRSPAFPNRRSP